MNLDIKLIRQTMEVIFGAIVGTIVSQSINNTHILNKVDLCVVPYVNSQIPSSYEFVQCMKGQFPDAFANAYKDKIESDCKLKVESQ